MKYSAFLGRARDDDKGASDETDDRVDSASCCVGERHGLETLVGVDLIGVETMNRSSLSLLTSLSSAERLWLSGVFFFSAATYDISAEGMFVMYELFVLEKT